MKKFSKIAGMAALSAVVLVSCVKNEESDGVKNIRNAQANLINAQAENVLATVKKTLEEVNGLYYANLKTKYQAQVDSCTAAIKEATSAKEIADAENAMAIAALVYQADVLEKQADLERAKIEIKNAMLELADNENEVMHGYLETYEQLLSDVQECQYDIAQYQYALVNDFATDKTYNESQLAYYTMQKKYDQKRYDDLKGAEAAWKNVLAYPETAAAALVTAREDMRVARLARNEKEIAYENADEAQQRANDAWGYAGDVVSALNSKIAILSANSVTSGTVDGVEYKSIFSYENEIISLNNNNHSQKLTIANSTEQLNYWNAHLTTWQGKLTALTATYNSTKSAYNTAHTAYSTALANYNAAVDADNENSTATTQAALTAAQAALTTATTNQTDAETAYAHAESLYNQAQNEVVIAQNNVNNYSTDILDANAVIADNTNKIGTLTTQKATAVAQQADFSSQLAAAVTAEEAARVAYVAAVEAYNVASLEFDVADDSYNNYYNLVVDLRNLRDGETDLARGYEQLLASYLTDIAEDQDQIDDYTALLAQNGAIKVADEAYIAGLNAKLTALQAELAKYAAIIAAE
jgi:hypothetical protein